MLRYRCMIGLYFEVFKSSSHRVLCTLPYQSRLSNYQGLDLINDRAERDDVMPQCAASYLQLLTRTRDLSLHLNES